MKRKATPRKRKKRLSSAAHDYLVERLREIDEVFSANVDDIFGQFTRTLGLLHELAEVSRSRGKTAEQVREESIRSLDRAIGRLARRFRAAFAAARKRHPEVRLPAHRLPNPPSIWSDSRPPGKKGAPEIYTPQVRAFLVRDVDRELSVTKNTITVEEAIRRAARRRGYNPTPGRVGRLRKVYYES